MSQPAISIQMLAMEISEKCVGRYVAFDVETTGLSPERGDRIIEVGAVSIQNGCIVSEFNSMIHVDKKISRRAQKIHGISNGMLIGNPEPEEILPLFREYIADSILVAHNAQFDVKFLRHEFGRLGISLTNRFICTLEMSRKRFPYLPDYRLETVCRHLFGEIPQSLRLHRALSDARLVARVWMEMEGVSLPPFSPGGRGSG